MDQKRTMPSRTVRHREAVQQETNSQHLRQSLQLGSQPCRRERKGYHGTAVDQAAAVGDQLGAGTAGACGVGVPEDASQSVAQWQH